MSQQEQLVKLVYDQNPESIRQLWMWGTTIDEMMEFCDSRECPACPFYPCHGDMPQHLISGPSGTEYLWSINNGGTRT